MKRVWKRIKNIEVEQGSNKTPILNIHCIIEFVPSIVAEALVSNTEKVSSVQQCNDSFRRIKQVEKIKSRSFKTFPNYEYGSSIKIETHQAVKSSRYFPEWRCNILQYSKKKLSVLCSFYYNLYRIHWQKKSQSIWRNATLKISLNLANIGG